MNNPKFDQEVFEHANEVWEQYGNGGFLLDQPEKKIEEYCWKAYYRMGKHQKGKEVFEVHFVDGSYIEILANHAIMINSYTVVADGTEITFGHPMIVDYEKSTVAVMRADAPPGEFQER